MFSTSMQRTLWFILLILLQVLVFNHIHILGYATPMPFFYLLLILHSTTPRWVYILLGFAIGITIDIFSNTIGECASTMTFLGLITPHLLNMFSPADRSEEGFEPSVTTMQWSGFLRYTAAATLIFITLFFMMECFSFFHILTILKYIAGSSILTLFVICAMERIRQSVKKK